MSEVFEGAQQKTDDGWLIPCFHYRQPPATSEQIRAAEEQLGTALPAELAEFLRLHDGAWLFAYHRPGVERRWPERPVIRYRLFGTSDLVRKNTELLTNFRECVGDEPEYRDHQRLNYVPFGDALNGDYYAIGLEGERTDRVFLVHHEMYYAPYVGDETEFLYYPIANSLTSWFQLILDTDGWGGRGEDPWGAGL